MVKKIPAGERKVMYIDGKIICTECNKQMLHKSELQELLKKAMLDVIKETKSIEKIDRKKVDERMKQLNICMHGSYGGIKIGEQKFPIETPELKINRDEIPPLYTDEMEEKISKMVLPSIESARAKGMNNEQIMEVFRNMHRLGNAPFPLDKFEEVIRPIIEGSDMK